MPRHTPPLAPLDERQRYRPEEAAAYLRCSRRHIYDLLALGELRSIRDGRRRYVPGSEIIRRSTLPAEAA